MASTEVAVDIQSRIHAFEALSSCTSPKTAVKSSPNLLDAPNSPTSTSFRPIVPSPTNSSFKKPVSRSPSPSPPILGRKTSLLDLKDWVLDVGPVSQGSPPKSLSKPSSGEPQGARPPTRHVSDSSWRLHSSSTPLINLDTTTLSKSTAPPLPPRKASYSSLRSISVSNSSTSSLAKSPNALPLPLPSQPSRRKSDSLTVDHPYAPLLGTATPRAGHVPASSISSFHSVSLSSDGGTDCTTPGSISNFVATYPIDRDEGRLAGDGENGHERDDISLDDSYENVSASAISPCTSSVSHDWGEYMKRRAEPPKLPQRPKPPLKVNSSPTTTIRSDPTSPRISPPLLVKHPPPPPPPRSRGPPPSNRSSLASTIASDRSSILSTATSRTSISSVRPMLSTKPSPIAIPLQRQISRPTPVPPAARRRYEAVFCANVISCRRAEASERAKSPPPGRKSRQAAGWRGLSVDLITNPEENQSSEEAGPEVLDQEVGSDDRLDGRMIAMIWSASKLDRSKLKEIWCVLTIL